MAAGRDGGAAFWAIVPRTVSGRRDTTTLGRFTWTLAPTPDTVMMVFSTGWEATVLHLPRPSAATGDTLRGRADEATDYEPAFVALGPARAIRVDCSTGAGQAHPSLRTGMVPPRESHHLIP
jgi:hypothetical protein